jgi:hypothetical protein
MHTGMWFSIGMALVACKRDGAPQSTPPADARVAAAPDSRPRVAPDAVPVPMDAAEPVDAAAAPPRDSGTRPRPRSSTDAAPPPAPPDAGVAAGACRRTRFETKLVADACAEGGQAAAKAAMKKWLRAAKKQEARLECKSCHEKLSPDYPLKNDGLEHFQRLGGK